jgi:hypothetical protein
VENIVLTLHLILSSRTVAFVNEYLDPIRELLHDSNPVLLVAHADRINELLQRAYNVVRFDYALRCLTPLDFPWRYDPVSFLPVVLAISRSTTMCEMARILPGWRAASFLDHILQVRESCPRGHAEN